MLQLQIGGVLPFLCVLRCSLVPCWEIAVLFSQTQQRDGKNLRGVDSYCRDASRNFEVEQDVTDGVESYTGKKWHVESGAMKLLVVPKLAIWGNTVRIHWADSGGSLSSTVNREVDWQMLCDIELVAIPIWHARTRSKGWDGQVQFG